MSMSYEIKVSFSTLAEALAFMNAANGGGTPPTAAVKAEAPKAQPKATTSTAKPSESPAAGEVPPEAQAETPAAVTYPELQQAVMKVVALGDKGKTALTEIAASFGLATFKGSDASVWGPAKAKIEAVHAKLAGA